MQIDSTIDCNEKSSRVTCIGPTPPDDFELLAYADRLASADVVEHLSACPTCRERAYALGCEQQMVQVLLYRTACPRPLELGEYRMCLLSERRSAEVAAHLAFCPACCSELTTLDAFMTELTQPDKFNLLISRDS